MKVSKRHGRLRMRLDAVEVSLLDSLLAQLLEVLADEDADDEVTRRLFPAAYPDDADAEQDYRSITESGLREERRERIGACVTELSAGPDVDLADPDAGRRWIQVLNDLRLALGTRLGVSEDDQRVDPDDPDAGQWAIYYWLTAVQDAVVTGLMG